MASKVPSITGRTRQRTTRWTVRLTDRLARILIAVGGIGTIAAVSLVCVFLIWVVVPLFLPAKVGPAQTLPVKADVDQLLAVGIDNYSVTSWTIARGGTIRVAQLDTGAIVEQLDKENSPVNGVTSISRSPGEDFAAFGMESGEIRLGKIVYDYQLIPSNKLTAEQQKIKPGEIISLSEGAILTRTDQGEFRRQKFAITFDEPFDFGIQSSIVKIDHVRRPQGNRIVTLSADGKLRVHLVNITKNAITEEVETETATGYLPLPSDATPPDYVLISELGDTVFAAWRDGKLLRYETRNIANPKLMEEVDLVREPGHFLTSLEFLLGRNTLVAGDSLGRIRAWFTVKADPTERSGDELIPDDDKVLVQAHEIRAQGHAVTSLASSPRDRVVAAGFADGTVRLMHLAARRILSEMECIPEAAPTAVAIGPKGNVLLALTDKGTTRWDFDARHPEATLGMLFLPVWYENYPRPEHAWQSTGSSDASEAKLGLMPLIYGTFKATFYTMLFGAPLALLAAIYSSEFLHPRLKSRIKPTIEMMASLPSVVLGFLAGMVIAPFVEHIVPEVLTCLVTVPLAFLFGGYLWQLLPSDVAVRLSRIRLALVMLMMPLGIYMGVKLGPLVEEWLFAGNLKEWLDHQRGSGVGGWVLLMLPLSAVLTALLFAQNVNPWLRRHSTGWTRTQAGLADLMKFAGGVVVTVVIATTIAWALDALRFDPRGTFVGTYVQRNALIVGFAMGFAIIPLIYTIADDALSTVPDHLRSASLGAGATPWQTAVRIVIPTAMSGLFSALMIGLGRAVGETMIVLMAAGSTPVMSWNIFAGFETLSMALATELPEAAKNSTHYRTLFLAALTLFVITFIVNTVAEVVRQRFRRRAYEL